MENLTSLQDDTQGLESGTFLPDLRFFLVRIFYPCLLIWGTIGNALCLRVLLSKKFIKNSTCQYLAILAVIDILFIMMRSSKHVYKLFRDTPIFNTSQWVCRILTFFSSALAHMASWILVIVSFDRYLIVTSRYRRRSSSASRVFCSTSVLIATVALCNLYYFFILGRTVIVPGYHSSTVQDEVFNESTVDADNETETMDASESLQSNIVLTFMCIPSHGYEPFFRTYIPVFDILLVAVIPFFLLCFTNIGIIIYTMRTNRRMRQHRKRAHRRHQRLTLMLLSVALAFIGFTCPSVIFICVNKIIYSMRVPSGEKSNNHLLGLVSIRQPSNVQLIVDVCEALWYTKHAMNFILYTLSGQDFRREFIKLFTQYFHQRPNMANKPTTQMQTAIEDAAESSLIERSTIIMHDHRKKIEQKHHRKSRSVDCCSDQLQTPIVDHSIRMNHSCS